MHANHTRFLLASPLLICAIALSVALMGCSVVNPKSSAQSSSSTFVSVSEKTVEVPEKSPVSESVEAAPAASYVEQLNAELSQIANESAMNVGIAFVDLTAPSNACFVNADVPQRSASMIKLLILNEFYEQVRAGSVSRDEPYTLTGGDIVGGTGILQGRGAGAVTTYGEMADLMISQSDNTATNVIINRLGMGNINARAAALGLTGSSLQRLMMDTDAIANGIENYMSARDAATLLQMIYNGTFVDAESSNFALTALENQADSNGILGGLPYGTPFAHKTGTLSNAQNDAGIVLNDRPYVLSVFCESNGGFSQGEALGVMSRCAEAVTAAMG